MAVSYRISELQTRLANIHYLLTVLDETDGAKERLLALSSSTEAELAQLAAIYDSIGFAA